MTFFRQVTTSDLSPSWTGTRPLNYDLSQATPANANTFSPNLNASEIRPVGLITISTLPNNDSWESGATWTQEYEVTSPEMDARGRVRVVMLDSAGTILQSGSFTSFTTFSTSGFATFSPVAPTWTATEACSNRLAFEWQLENLNTMFSVTPGFRLQSDSSPNSYEYITDLSINTASCTVSTFTPKIILY